MEHAILVLNIDLFGWKDVMNKLEKDIAKDYPDEFNTRQYNEASEKVNELNKAIKILSDIQSAPVAQ